MTISRVQHGSSGATFEAASQIGSTGVAYAPYGGTPVTAGDLLTLGVTITDPTGGSAISAVTVTDSINGAWSLATGIATSDVYTAIWYKKNAASGSPTITVKWTDSFSGSTVSLKYQEYNLPSSTVLDGTSSKDNTVNGTTFTSNAATTTLTDLLLGYWDVGGATNFATLTGEASWTVVDSVRNGTANTFLVEDFGVGTTGEAAGNYAATGTTTSSFNQGRAVVAGFSVPVPVTTDRTVTAKARIQVKTDQTKLAKAAIRRTTDQTATAKGAVRRTTDQTTTATARLNVKTDRTVTAKADVRTTTDRTTTAKGDVRATADRTATGTGRAAVLTNRLLTALGRLRVATNRSVSAKGAVQNTTVQAIAGVASIAPGPYRPPTIVDLPALGPFPDYAIRIRDASSFALIAEVDHYLTASYTRRFQTQGEFQLVLNGGHPLIGAIARPQTLVEFVRDGVSDFVGRVLHLQAGPLVGDRLSAGAGGGQSNTYGQDEASITWTLSGPDLSDFAAARVALPFPLGTQDGAQAMGAASDDVSDMAADTAMRHYVQVNMLSAAETRRNYPFLALGSVFAPGQSVPVTTTQWAYTGQLNQLQQFESLWGQAINAVAPYLDPGSGLSRLGPVNLSPTGAHLVQVQNGVLNGVSYQARGESVTTVLTKLAQTASAPTATNPNPPPIGYQFRLDLTQPVGSYRGTVLFDVLVSADRTADTTSGYAPAVFSVDRGALRSFSYTNDGLSLANAIYAAGQNDAAARALQMLRGEIVQNALAFPYGKLASVFAQALTGDGNAFQVPPLNTLLPTLPSGLGLPFQIAPGAEAQLDTQASALREFVSGTSIDLWGRREEWYNLPNYSDLGSLQDAANAELTTHQDLQTVQFTPQDTSTLQYRRDWDLGDRVTVVCEPFNIRADNVVQEVKVTLAWPGSGSLYPPVMALTVGPIPRWHLARQTQDLIQKVQFAVNL